MEDDEAGLGLEHRGTAQHENFPEGELPDGSSTQPNNPLHGITLEAILNHLVDH